jgi:hypothetical protein
MSFFLSLVGGVPRSISESASVPIYDQPMTIAAPTTAGTSVTLPASGTYNGEELEIRLNGQRMEALYDYNYVGSGTAKTQVQFTFDLAIGDRLDFRIDRGQ